MSNAGEPIIDQPSAHAVTGHVGGLSVQFRKSKMWMNLKGQFRKSNISRVDKYI